jgi:hypothetical protein
VLSVLFGAIILIAPGAGALGLVWAIAAYSIVLASFSSPFPYDCGNTATVLQLLRRRDDAKWAGRVRVP